MKSFKNEIENALEEDEDAINFVNYVLFENINYVSPFTLANKSQSLKAIEAMLEILLLNV